MCNVNEYALHTHILGSCYRISILLCSVNSNRDFPCCCCHSSVKFSICAISCICHTLDSYLQKDNIQSAYCISCILTKYLKGMQYSSKHVKTSDFVQDVQLNPSSIRWQNDMSWRHYFNNQMIRFTTCTIKISYTWEMARVLLSINAQQQPDQGNEVSLHKCL